MAGKASWYCKVGRSACHYAYPDGAMVAAACGPLRAALGANWRNRVVTVAAGSRSVRVRLVDKCASTDKTIDLYAAAFARLAPLSLGTVRIKVGW